MAPGEKPLDASQLAAMASAQRARRRPNSVRGLEELGRVRLSRNFFLRDFLLSEIAMIHGLPNIPDQPDLAIAAGERLCEDLLEPIQSIYGRIAIRSAYRSCAVNALGNRLGLSCASNERNYARHIWDRRASDGSIGAMACIVVPWLVDHVAKGGHWNEMARWIHEHLPYSELQFFPKLYAFNIGWREKPRRKIQSFIHPRGSLLDAEGQLRLVNR